MSAVLGGPPFVLNGPRPSPPRYRLLDAARIVDETDLHWGLGGDVWAYPPDMPGKWIQCMNGGTFTKLEGGSIPSPRFGSFTLYLAATCTARGIGGNEEHDEYVARAEAAFLAVESWGIEHEFSQGTIQPGNPFLSDASAQILAGGTAVESRVGLSYLANAIARGNANGEGGGRAGMIHSTPGIAESWGVLGTKSDGQGLFSSTGIPIVVGSGYIGASPVGETVADPDDGVEWAFATGPVDIRRSELFTTPDSVQGAVDRGTNTVTYRVERTYLVDWDTVLQAAVLIDWTL